MPGNGYVQLAYGPYTNRVAVGSLGGCVGQTAHELVSDAIALVGALKAAPQMWSSSANAAQIEALMSEYSAGEIGAAALLIGVGTLLDAATIGAILIAGGAVGVTLYSILDTVYCMVKNGSSLGFERPSLKRWA